MILPSLDLLSLQVATVTMVKLVAFMLIALWAESKEFAEELVGEVAEEVARKVATQASVPLAALVVH